ncbi:hypothetical protein ABMA27_000042 [Loxostege sticticalis]|uniref:Peptidase aspartic putative domain-containing protein n=1 Tax=Loxostege sticticalis TaxID=481309 RepID=A0ABR3ILX6_LOXSC
MPTTRSQASAAAGVKEMEDSRRYVEPPASPSVQADTCGVPAESGGIGENVAPTDGRRNTAVVETRPKPPSSRGSGAAARIKEAELQAAEKLAALQKRELELEAQLIKKRLAFEIATIMESDEENDRESSVPAGEVRARVDDWLDQSQSRRQVDTAQPVEKSYDVSTLIQNRNERDRHMFTRQKEKEARKIEMDKNRHLNSPSTPSIGINIETERFQDKTTCNAGPQENIDGVERLAVTLEKIMSKRPAPRQALELPTFNGNPTDWLPFKIAMQESTRICGFSKAENLARLRNCLKGEAREAVAALLSCASDPEQVMRTLEQCYGRPEVIVDRALNDLRSLPRVGATASELNAFAIRVQNIACMLDSIDSRGYLRNPMMTREVTEKLSPHLKSRWCDYATEHASYTEPEIITLSNFLMNEANKALRFAYAPQSSSSGVKKEIARARENVNARKRSTGVYVTADEKQTSNDKPCLCCGGGHEVSQCKKFTTMTISQRWDWLKQERICFLCLNSKHRQFRCKAQLCKVNGCKRRHHSMLHRESGSENKQQATEVVASVNHSADASRVLLKVCPIIIEGPRGRAQTYALLDEGSTVTLIDRDLADYVGANGPARDLNLCSVNSQNVPHKSMEVDIRVIARDNKKFAVKARTMENMSLNGQTIKENCLKYRHMRRLKREDVCYENARPRVLIGTDNWQLIVSRKLLTGKRHEPAASLTRLGWVIHGLAPSRVIRDSDTVLYVDSKCRAERSTKPLDDELHSMVKEYFEIDSLGIVKKARENPDETRAIESFKSTVKNVDKRYKVGLPWRKEDISMPPSYDQARRRLLAIENKMDKSVEFKERYTAQMNNMFEKGYAEESQGNELESPKLWYLPHFAVINVNKPGKLRLVFDAAAKSNGVCLNDALLEGPDMLRDLAGILFRFRERAVAVTADIREMFLQVKIVEENQPAQMFLWRGDDRTSPPKSYKMTSMIFGAKSSPFLAHSVRDHNATKHAIEFPRAHEAITMNHYMDDWVDCFDTVLLTAAKARVAPIKAQTIPRLELQACLIGARLATTIIREHRWQPHRVVYWTDSRTVLHWINNDRVRYPPYVAHRLNEISELTEPEQWKWVPTRDNVADDATRIVNDVKCKDDRWFIGPSFLYENEDSWPSLNVIDDCDIGRHDDVVLNVTNMKWSVPDAGRFSKHERLVRKSYITGGAAPRGGVGAHDTLCQERSARHTQREGAAR